MDQFAAQLKASLLTLSSDTVDDEDEYNEVSVDFIDHIIIYELLFFSFNFLCKNYHFI